jgi:hypothetical protein
LSSSKKSEDEHRNAVRYDDGKPELRLATPTEDEHSDYEYLDAIEDDKGKPTSEVATNIVQTNIMPNEEQRSYGMTFHTTLAKQRLATLVISCKYFSLAPKCN